MLSGTGTTSSNDLATAIATSDTLVVNGTTFAFVAGTSSSGTSIGIGDTVAHLLSTINAAAGVTASISGGAITVAGSTAGLTLSGTALAKLGLTSVGDGLAGQTLTVGATGGGTQTSITFGLGTGQVSTLNDLNTKLAANNLQATIDSATGKINIVTTNDAASSTIGTIGGSASSTGGAFFGVTAPAAPVADPNAQSTRAALVAQYNNVLTQINTTAQDSSFNGVNLLNGDTLKLVFNETGKSTLSITGVTFNAVGLGLTTVVRAPTSSTTRRRTRRSTRSRLLRARCARKHPRSVRTSRSCRSVRTSTRT